MDSVLRPILQPIRRGLNIALGQVLPVQYIGASPIIITTALSASVSRSSIGMAVGDYQLLIVVARSAITTPTGFTLLANATGFAAAQNLSLFGKVAVSGDTSTSIGVAQASSNVLNACLLAFRGNGGAILDGVTTGTAQDTTNTSVYPTRTPGALGYAVGVISPSLIAGGSTSNTPFPTDWINVYPGGLNSPRLFVAIRPVPNLTPLTGGTTASWAAGSTCTWFSATATITATQPLTTQSGAPLTAEDGFTPLTTG